MRSIDMMKSHADRAGIELRNILDGKDVVYSWISNFSHFLECSFPRSRRKLTPIVVDQVRAMAFYTSCGRLLTIDIESIDYRKLLRDRDKICKILDKVDRVRKKEMFDADQIEALIAFCSHLSWCCTNLDWNNV